MVLHSCLYQEGAGHSWGSPTETRPPLPPRGLPSPSLHPPVTPERQTSDWPSYISDQIPLGSCGLKSSGPAKMPPPPEVLSRCSFPSLSSLKSDFFLLNFFLVLLLCSLSGRSLGTSCGSWRDQSMHGSQ